MSHSNRLQLGAALWGVLIGLGLAIAIAACASGAATTRAPESAGADAAMVRNDMDPRKQAILDKWNEIGEWRESKGLIRDPLKAQKPPSHADLEALQRSTLSKIRECPAQEEPPKTDECTDVCSLKDDICDNAASICRIADDLGDDAWAREKCTSAKQSCKEATEKCCGCLADEKPATAPTGAETGGAVH
jgi:hypothetical protein